MSHCQAATHEGDGKPGDLLVRASPVLPPPPQRANPIGSGPEATDAPQQETVRLSPQRAGGINLPAGDLLSTKGMG
jgi:hypothetical protein